jgi:protein disulfide-isomerase A1
MYAGDLAEKVTIAKVDATANDVPDEIQGFPTIKLYPAGKKDSPIDYSGSRTVEDLAQFIKENGSHKVEGVAPKAADAEEPEESSSAATDKATEAAKEATESVKSAASEATEAVKSATTEDEDVHDEL